MQKVLGRFVILSEITHVFCCVLPMLAVISSLAAGVGASSFIPASVLSFHDMMHDYEIPLITFSFVLLSLAWGLQIYSLRVDCRKDALCAHEPCAPKKQKASKLLKIATVIFIINISVYFGLHYGVDTSGINATENSQHNHPHNHPH
jgi:hypothetical protein